MDSEQETSQRDDRLQRSEIAAAVDAFVSEGGGRPPHLSLHSPRARAALTECSAEECCRMAELGVRREAGLYHFGGGHYVYWEEAVAYARIAAALPARAIDEDLRVQPQGADLAG